MKLKALLGPELTAPAGCEETEIVGIAADSRAVQPGSLFVALRGSNADGTCFLPEAVARGAAAVLVEKGGTADARFGVPVLTAAAPRRALALMAARWYASQPEAIVAVTGTSGKTSVAEFARQILALLGRKAASLGTIGLLKPNGGSYGSLTTP